MIIEYIGYATQILMITALIVCIIGLIQLIIDLRIDNIKIRKDLKQIAELRKKEKELNEKCITRV